MASASASERPESSRARERAEHLEVVLGLQARPWVALSCVAVVLGADDPRAANLVPGAEDLILDLRPPPSGASYVLLPKRIVPDPRSFSFPYIVAAHSDHLLFMATTGNRERKFAYYLGDARVRTAARLPEVPASLRDFGLDVALRRSIGLIADPRHDGHYLVAQLHPTSAARHDTLLCYSSFSGEWSAKPLASAPDHERWGADGVVAHGGKLWWVDMAYGLLVCDPSAAADDLHLRFVPLPFGCKLQDLGDGPRPTALINRLRIVRPSQGMLRYVEIRGVPLRAAASIADQPPLNQAPELRMFTLVDVDMEGDGWRHDFTVPFADLWAHPSYSEAGLLKEVLPSLACIDPNDPKLVYFFQGTTLFGIDLVARQVVRHVEFVVDAEFQKTKFQSSCFVLAWEMPPELAMLLDDDDYDAWSIGSQSDGDDELEFADPRLSILKDIQCVQDKINVERDFIELEKLFRQRAYLKEVLKSLD